MGLKRTWHHWGLLTACGLLLGTLGACTDGGSAGDAGRPAASDSAAGSSARASADAGGAGAPADAPTATADPAKVPKTAGAARALVSTVIADPDLVGSGAVRATPYESDATTWAVLDAGCAWQRKPLPDDVLATLTRHFTMPAAQGKGAALRLTATVTVHRTTLQAAWEQAGMLEEAMACPEQTLRPGERLTGLKSSAFAYGEGANRFSDDLLQERGECSGGTSGGPHRYWWTQATFGPVVVSASVCGGQEGDDEATDVVQSYFVAMLHSAKDEIGRPADRGPSPTAPGTTTPGTAGKSGTPAPSGTADGGREGGA